MKMKFRDDNHKKFYEEKLIETNSVNDTYRKSLFYTLGILKETRDNINSLYDFKGNCIRFEGLKEEWQTGTSIKVCRLAFNLYNGLYGQHDEGESAESYTPYGLFNCSVMEYMFEAIKIRYEIYAWLPH